MFLWWKFITILPPAREPAGPLFGIGEKVPDALDRAGEGAGEANFAARAKLAVSVVRFHGRVWWARITMQAGDGACEIN